MYKCFISHSFMKLYYLLRYYVVIANNHSSKIEDPIRTLNIDAGLMQKDSNKGKYYNISTGRQGGEFHVIRMVVILIELALEPLKREFKTGSACASSVRF